MIIRVFDDPTDHDDYRFSDLIEEFNIYPLIGDAGNTLRWDIDDGQLKLLVLLFPRASDTAIAIDLGFYVPLPITPFIEGEELAYFSSGLYDVNEKWQVYSRLIMMSMKLCSAAIMWGSRDMCDYYALFQIEHDSHPFLGDELALRGGAAVLGNRWTPGQTINPHPFIKSDAMMK